MRRRGTASSTRQARNQVDRPRRRRHGRGGPGRVLVDDEPSLIGPVDSQRGAAAFDSRSSVARRPATTRPSSRSTLRTEQSGRVGLRRRAPSTINKWMRRPRLGRSTLCSRSPRSGTARSWSAGPSPTTPPRSSPSSRRRSGSFSVQPRPVLGYGRATLPARAPCNTLGGGAPAIPAGWRAGFRPPVRGALPCREHPIRSRAGRTSHGNNASTSRQ